MSLNVDFKYGNYHAVGATRAEPIPRKKLEGIVNEYTAGVQKQIDDVKAQLEKSPGASYLQERLEKLEGLLNTDLSRVAGTSGRKLLLQSEAVGFEDADAGHAKAACANATLWTVGFGYESHRAMEGFLTDVPKNKKVTFN